MGEMRPQRILESGMYGPQLLQTGALPGFVECDAETQKGVNKSGQSFEYCAKPTATEAPLNAWPNP